MTVMEGIAHYVQKKRTNGIGFEKAHSNLLAFGRQVGDTAIEHVSTQDILKYLNGPLTSTVTWRGKHSLLRHFFEFWDARGVASLPLMPPPRPLERQTFTPHIYSRAEIRALLRAAKACQSSDNCSFDAETLRSLIIVLYGTGALVGQVLTLTRKGVDLRHNIVTFQSGRFGRSRSIPIGPDLRETFKLHLARTRGINKSTFFPAKKNGQQLEAVTLIHTFRRLRKLARVSRNDGSYYQPRLHDLRATFAVHRITSWIKNGADLNRMLPALSTYMGNMGLTAAERYLLLTPERFRRDLNKLSPAKGRKRWRDDPFLMSFLSGL